ncbi:hypothetical protein [Microbacterium sp. cf332]|uniref:hypothetical protein n=1 Tax=Microbacterium sp. cf332 TaxID=1761804 RepID=UPI000886A5FC|nr:hypothetical protein [Microbacterium sp. cf332]SDQ19862.1 hypothetical protein SAMN04487847_0845 [Microbacterium sp. cf332]
MNTQTKASTAARATSDGTLGLGSVLAGSLPRGLATPEAPSRYTVEAVFTRRPQRREILSIIGDETRALLGSYGYDMVRLAVSDRRLEIHNTSLEELRDGLSTRIADRLAAIGDETRAYEDAAALRSLDAAEDERIRAGKVADLAASITFSVSAQRTSVSVARATSDDAPAEAWANEGGHAPAA